MRKAFNFEKEQYRGTIKQLMKVRGFRTLSISNYYNWKNTISDSTIDVGNVATLKYNLQDGYLNMFDKHNNKIDDETAANIYKNVYDVVVDMLENEYNIPYKKRRNILVKINR